MARGDGVRWDGKHRCWWSTVRLDDGSKSNRLVWLEKHEDRSHAEAGTKSTELALRAPCHICGRKEGNALAKAMGSKKRKRKDESERNREEENPRDRKALENAERQTRAIATAIRDLVAQRTFDASRNDLLETQEPKTLLLAALVAEEWAKTLRDRHRGAE